MASSGPDMEQAPSERIPPELPPPERPVAVPLHVGTTHPDPAVAGQQHFTIGSDPGGEPGEAEEDLQTETIQPPAAGAPGEAEVEPSPPEDWASDDPVQAAPSQAAATAQASEAEAGAEHSPSDMPETLGTPPETPYQPTCPASLNDKGYSPVSDMLCPEPEVEVPLRNPVPKDVEFAHVEASSQMTGSNQPGSNLSGSNQGQTGRAITPPAGDGFVQRTSVEAAMGGRRQQQPWDDPNAQDDPDSPCRAGIKEHLDPSELRVLERVGSGAQAEVYCAIWWRCFGCSTSAITVAVKHLHAASGERAQTNESLTRRMSHPNLVKCFEATATAPFLIVSEFCGGGSLYECIHDSSHKLTWPQRIKILLDVTKGMEYLHNQDPIILHRDLKSCNVLLTKHLKNAGQTPHAKVADFGLSRAAKTSEAFMTKCVGTWRWMAPEVFYSNEYDERIDVFSFGVLMFEVLSGEIPYADVWPPNSKAVNPRIGLHIFNGYRPNVRLVQPGCPRKAVAIMQECWDSDRTKRPDFGYLKTHLQDQLDLVNMYSQVNHGVKSF